MDIHEEGHPIEDKERTLDIIQSEFQDEIKSIQTETDALNDFLDEQARLRCLEQSWDMTGQEM